MFIVSDMRAKGYIISAMFSGLGAKASADNWAGAAGKVTRIRSIAIGKSLQVGSRLPNRYAR